MIGATERHNSDEDSGVRDKGNSETSETRKRRRTSKCRRHQEFLCREMCLNRKFVEIERKSHHAGDPVQDLRGQSEKLVMFVPSLL